jgi:predicted helicase
VVASRQQQLPFNQLSWEEFERLCVRLVKQDADTEFAQSYGRRGQEQEGIDLYVRKRSTGRYVVWQCKRYQNFKKSDVVSAARKFLKAFRKNDAGIPIKDADVFILAVPPILSSMADEITLIDCVDMWADRSL